MPNDALPSWSSAITHQPEVRLAFGTRVKRSAYTGHFDSSVIAPPSESPALYTLTRRVAPNFLAVEPKQNGL